MGFAVPDALLQSGEGRIAMTWLAWVIFVCAATLEVGGDAIIRRGLKSQGVPLILLGFVMLGCYGLVVNLVRWDFTKLLGVYVGVFALISVLAGKYLFKESVPSTTWIGLGMILAGALTIQFGHS